MLWFCCCQWFSRNGNTVNYASEMCKYWFTFSGISCGKKLRRIRRYVESTSWDARSMGGWGEHESVRVTWYHEYNSLKGRDWNWLHTAHQKAILHKRTFYRLKTRRKHDFGTRKFLLSLNNPFSKQEIESDSFARYMYLNPERKHCIVFE